MRRTVLGSAAAVAVAAMGLAIVSASPAQASGNNDFGKHVAECAQTMGFDGTHNPGMHRGASGWDGAECDHA